MVAKHASLAPTKRKHRHRDGHAERVGGVEGGERRADLEHLAVGGVRPHQRLDVIDQVLVPAHRDALLRGARGHLGLDAVLDAEPLERADVPRLLPEDAVPLHVGIAGEERDERRDDGERAPRARARPGGCRSAATERRRGVTPRRAARRGGCQGSAGGPRRSEEMRACVHDRRSPAAPEQRERAVSEDTSATRSP